ncbi:MAG TPA: ATP-binding protein [Gemmatimonas sp.]|nr:ATP-binding protein [Gemmatimonas sp.]
MTETLNDRQDMTAGISADRAIEIVRALSATAGRISMATPSVEAVDRLLRNTAPLGLDFIVVGVLSEDARSIRPITSHGVDRRDIPVLPVDGSMPITAAILESRVIDLPQSRADKLARFPQAEKLTRLPLDHEWICYPVEWGGQMRAAVTVAAGPDGFTGESRFVLDILAIEIGRVLERSAGVRGLGHWEWHSGSDEMLWCDQTRTMHGYPVDGRAPGFDQYIALIHPSDRAAVTEQLQHALANATEGTSVDMEFRVVRPNGEVRSIHSHAQVVRQRDGGLRFFGTNEDVTDRRRLDEKLRATQQMEALGLLAGGIAHDFNNLLVGILGNASLAGSELEPTSPIAPMLRDIEHSAQRAADLTRQLLAYAGKGRFIVRPVDLAQLVHEMRALLGTAITRRATLDINAEYDQAWVQADATQLRQIIINLITNASDALAGEHGRIVLRAGVRTLGADQLVSTHGQSSLAPGRYAVLEVNDTGRGMNPRTLPRIFDPFFTTKDSGHGLGLSATLGIIRGHGGIIQVDSTRGQGCTMRVVLPLVAAPSRGEPAARVTPTTGHSGTALLVDDDDAVRNVARRTLERAGFTVHEAIDGAQGVARFEELRGTVSIVLLDLTMPVMSGEEALGHMREQDAAVPILLSSGYNEQEITGRLNGTHHVGFIQKPYTVAELLAAVQALLDPD